jgi:hypothetical protein
MKCSIRFFDSKVRENFYTLEHSSSEDNMMYNALRRAILKLENDYRSGTFIEKSRVPKSYRKKYGASTLWKHDLPGGWRLIYMVSNDETNQPIVIILKWMSHIQYNKDFGYN